MVNIDFIVKITYRQPDSKQKEIDCGFMMIYGPFDKEQYPDVCNNNSVSFSIIV